MTVYPVFEIEDHFVTHLWTSAYEESGTDEFAQTFENWTSPDYLSDFFLKNEHDLMSGYYKIVSIEDAVLKTQQMALEFEEKLLKAGGIMADVNSFLDDLFFPLYKRDTEYESHLKKNKTKIENQKWLRLYAIKLNPSCYIVAANAIKLTKTMDRGHFNAVFKKLNITRSFLTERMCFTFDNLVDKFS